MPQIDIYTKQQTDAKLDTKQASLDSTQLDAVNSGITAEKVGIYDGYATAIAGKMDTSSFYTIGGNYGSDNPVTTQSFVNSSISTNTATYKGNLTITDLDDTENPGQKLTADATNAQVAASLNAMTFTPAADNNDYCFVYVPAHEDSQQQAVASRYDRYKFAEDTATPANSTWAYEYTLNNSGFTAVQWEAINSGINSTKVGIYDGYATDISGCAKLSGGTSPSPQTFTGLNKFTNSIFTEFSSSNEHQVPYAFTNTNIATKTTIPSSTMNFYLGLIGNTDRQAISTFTTQIAPTSRNSTLLLVSQRGSNLNFGMVSNTTQDYAVAPYRTTGLGSTDVITKGNLEASDYTFAGSNVFSYVPYEGNPNGGVFGYFNVTRLAHIYGPDKLGWTYVCRVPTNVERFTGIYLEIYEDFTTSALYNKSMIRAYYDSNNTSVVNCLITTFGVSSLYLPTCCAVIETIDNVKYLGIWYCTGYDYSRAYLTRIHATHNGGLFTFSQITRPNIVQQNMPTTPTYDVVFEGTKVSYINGVKIQ